MVRLSNHLSNSLPSSFEENGNESGQNYSSSQLAQDALFESFSSQAADGRNLAAMSLGSLAFSSIRSLASPLFSALFRSGAGVQAVSWTTALLGEVATFRASSQVLSRQTPSETWYNPQAFAATTLDFALLKGFSHYLRSETFIIRHTVSASAMVAGEYLREAMQLTESHSQDFAHRFSHALVSSIALEAGGKLSALASGHLLQRMERSIHTQHQIETSRNRERTENRFATGQEAFIGFNPRAILQMSAEGEGKTRTLWVEGNRVHLEIAGRESPQEAHFAEVERALKRLLWYGETHECLGGIAEHIAEEFRSIRTRLSQGRGKLWLDARGNILALRITEAGKADYEIGEVPESPTRRESPPPSRQEETARKEGTQSKQENPEQKAEDVEATTAASENPETRPPAPVPVTTTASASPALLPVEGLALSHFRDPVCKGALVTINSYFEELTPLDTAWQAIQLQANQMMERAARSGNVAEQRALLGAIQNILGNHERLLGPSDVRELLDRMERGVSLTNVQKYMGILMGSAARRRAPASHGSETPVAPVIEESPEATTGEVSREKTIEDPSPENARQDQGEENSGQEGGHEERNHHPEETDATSAQAESRNEKDSIVARVDTLKRKAQSIYSEGSGRAEGLENGRRISHVYATLRSIQTSWDQQKLRTAEVHFLLDAIDSRLDTREKTGSVGEWLERLERPRGLIGALSSLATHCEQDPRWREVLELAQATFHQLAVETPATGKLYAQRCSLLEKILNRRNENLPPEELLEILRQFQIKYSLLEKGNRTHQDLIRAMLKSIGDPDTPPADADESAPRTPRPPAPAEAETSPAPVSFTPRLAVDQKIDFLRAEINRSYESMVSAGGPLNASGVKAARSKALAAIEASRSRLLEAQIEFLLDQFQISLSNHESMERVSKIRDRMNYRSNILAELTALSRRPTWIETYEKANEVFHLLLLIEETTSYTAFIRRFEEILLSRKTKGQGKHAILRELRALESDIQKRGPSNNGSGNPPASPTPEENPAEEIQAPPEEFAAPEDAASSAVSEPAEPATARNTEAVVETPEAPPSTEELPAPVPPPTESTADTSTVSPDIHAEGPTGRPRDLSPSPRVAPSPVLAPEVVRYINTLLPRGITVSRHTHRDQALVSARKALAGADQKTICEGIRHIMEQLTQTAYTTGGSKAQSNAIKAVYDRIINMTANKNVSQGFVEGVFEIAAILAGENNKTSAKTSGTDPRINHTSPFVLLAQSAPSLLNTLERMQTDLQFVLDNPDSFDATERAQELQDHSPRLPFARDILGDDSTLSLEQLANTFRSSPEVCVLLGDPLVGAISAYIAFFNRAKRSLLPESSTQDSLTN